MGDKQNLLAKDNEWQEKYEILHTELVEKSAELEAIKEKLILQEKMASLGQLAAGIAHEIKNPMNFVNNFSELNLEYLSEIRDELTKLPQNETTEEINDLLYDVEDNLTKILQHGKRADRILKSMLLHSRGGNAILEPTDLNELTKEYVNLAFHGMKASKTAINVKIEYELDDHLEKVNLNPEEFSRVILNLCKNAFDAMRSKLLTFNDNSYLPILKIHTKRNNDTTLLIIEDNGPGVSDTLKNRLFEPFFTTKKGNDGTGLGLSITHDIIIKHGGDIHIDSEENEFTRFEITLPYNQIL